MVRGEAIGSLGMTEPHAGSDLRSIRTRARTGRGSLRHRRSEGVHLNGQSCDVLVLATRTAGDTHKGITLFLIDTSLPGFKRGRNLEKLGLKAQDTSELFFEGLRVPATAVLGGEGQGFNLMMQKLAQERAQAIRSATVAETVIEWTVDVLSRSARPSARPSRISRTRSSNWQS